MPRKWSWKNVEFPTALADELGLRFEAGVLETKLSGLRESPLRVSSEEVDLLASLGDVYARLGKLEENLDVDLTLVRLRPSNSKFHYNLACTYSRLGQLEPALGALKKALKLGYRNVEQLRNDADFDNLKEDKRFLRLLKYLEERIS